MTEFKYQDPFPLGKDTTKYRLLTNDYVSVVNLEGHKLLKVDPEGLTYLANHAMRDVSFLLRPAHNEMVAKILSDPEASPNDRGVAIAMLRNAEVAARFELPICQDTGTATIVGKKGQKVWTGARDEEYLSKGVYKTYTEENLRYSQNVPLNMYEEQNTGCNLPAQTDLYTTDGDEYKFLFVAKGGGSGNKTYLFQETKALLNPEVLEQFLVAKMKTLGTAACPPYHLAFVIGGTSAESCLKIMKLATTATLTPFLLKGMKGARPFATLRWKISSSGQPKRLGSELSSAANILPTTSVSSACPVGMGVSCSAHRNIKARINKEGIWLEEMDRNPGRLIPEKYRVKHEEGIVKINLN